MNLHATNSLFHLLLFSCTASRSVCLRQPPSSHLSTQGTSKIQIQFGSMAQLLCRYSLPIAIASTLVSRSLTKAVKMDRFHFLMFAFEFTPDCTITHRLYRKPSDSGVNVDFHSQVHRSVKCVVGRQHFVRGRKNSSSPAQACESPGMAKKLLRSTNYPEVIIEEIGRKKLPHRPTTCNQRKLC